MKRKWPELSIYCVWRSFFCQKFRIFFVTIHDFEKTPENGFSQPAGSIIISILS